MGRIVAPRTNPNKVIQVAAVSAAARFLARAAVPGDADRDFSTPVAQDSGKRDPHGLDCPFMSPRPLLLFDGVCNLCHSSVRWVLDRDKEARFDFASLQSSIGREHLARGWPDGDEPDSLVLVWEDKLSVRSDAAIGVARLLGFPWSLAAVFLIVPRFLRDGIYAWVARNRYRWFGHKDVCSLPAPGQMERFLDAGEDLGAPPDKPAQD